MRKNIKSMRKIAITLILASAMPILASADVTVKFPAGEGNGTYYVQQMLISDIANAHGQRPKYTIDSIPAVNGELKFMENTEGPAQCTILIERGKAIQLYTEPGINLDVDITSVSPFDYSVTGSELMENISALDKKSREVEKQYIELSKAEPRDEKAVETLLDDFHKYFADYVTTNKNSPARVYAALQISDPELFLKTIDELDESDKTSILYPLLVPQKEYVEKRLAAEKKRMELASGTHDAPAFTLKGIDGKDVSLSDFKGKWVILDFWGTWCPWCIKGFPKLKETYEALKPNLEVIGIDCRESEEAWRDGVAKYELPWVNVYNPEGTTILQDYQVQGFPTKAIINPEGKIVNITVGEDPSFFETLAKLMDSKGVTQK